MTTGKLVIEERICALRGMDENKVVYRGYTIRWTGFNQRGLIKHGYPRGTKLGQFVAHIEDAHGDSICDIGYYQQVSLGPGDAPVLRKKPGAARLILLMDSELNLPRVRRSGWTSADTYCKVKGHCHSSKKSKGESKAAQS